MCFFCCSVLEAWLRCLAMPRSATATRGFAMFDYLLGVLTLAVLLGYLAYALINPERF